MTNTQGHMIIRVCCPWTWGHVKAGKRHCNLDRAVHEVPRWPAFGFSKLASLGMMGMTLLCSTCLSSSTMSRPDKFSWRWQRSKGIAKACNASWGQGSELAAPSSTLSPKANHKTSLGLKSREIDSAPLMKELQHHTIKATIGGWHIGTIDTLILLLMRNHHWHIFHFTLRLYVASTTICMDSAHLLHLSSRFRVPDQDIRVAETRSWSCILSQKHWETKCLHFFHFLWRRWVLPLTKPTEVENTSHIGKKFRCQITKNLTAIL